MVELAHERGYDAVSVEQIAARAGGDASEFERLFPSKLACAVAALEELAANNLGAVRGAFDREQRWPDSLRAAAYTHVEWIVDNPKKMRFGLLETLWASELTGALRDDLFGAYVEMVDAGREVAPDPEAIPEHTAEGVVGAITEVVARRLGPELDRELPALVPEMMCLAVRPYLGEEAAHRELTMPAPAVRSQGDV
jgi:AcrR family transcriptional regulator